MVLSDGTRLVGKVRALKDGVVSFKAAYGAKLTLPAGKIVGMATDGMVTLRFSDGGYVTGRLQSPPAGGIRLYPMAGGGPVAIELARVARLHPGTTIPTSLEWRGHFNLGVSVSSGNTDSEGYHADGAATARAEKDRVRVRGSFNRATESDVKTEDNYTIALQYDRFVSKALFVFTNLKLEHDDIAALNLRTTLGTGLGYQVLDSARSKLSLQAGPAYIIQDFEGQPDDESVAGRWAVNFEHYVWDRYAQLFHDHDGTVNADDTSDVFIDSSTGVRVFVHDGLNVTAQVDLDWDNKPAPGVSSLDKRYMLTVGYKW